MSFPPAPRENIADWSSPALALTRVNGHIQSRWSRRTGQWSEPEFVEDPFLRVHGLATVFHYGQEAYEGMKAFRSPDGEIHIVRPEAHAARMNRSAELVSIQPIPEEHFLRCVNLAVAYNADLVPPNSASAMLYIRPFVFGSGAWFQLSPTDEYLFCVFVAPTSALHGARPIDALILDDFDRAATRGVGSGKVGGNYAPVMRWSEKAKKEGFPITLHLDSQTQTEIEEFTTSAFVGIIDASKSTSGVTTLVVSNSRNIVESVTSDSIEHLAKTLGWAVERRTVKYAELQRFTEVLACGTGVAVVPIRSISRPSTADKFVYVDQDTGPGPYATLLADAINEAYKNAANDKFGWLRKVTSPVPTSNGQNGTKPDLKHKIENGELNGGLKSS
ncbi:branched-chain amino acid aminotransferase II [Lepidopterella palustris CBS 459.81]|uniref:Branched-chain amino acid aminotransferase II n=1 Tax=Lepidopterella palustris CBS 459.81 TaxID=1314670 RepID=A0A8E2E4Y2_9PEZI|nr:branched-chain amino acid aminotransferase II [Lepidopterella palustris CBS 459.81]